MEGEHSEAEVIKKIYDLNKGHSLGKMPTAHLAVTV